MNTELEIWNNACRAQIHEMKKHLAKVPNGLEFLRINDCPIANFKIMEYPKGTTKEQWDKYYEELDAHNKFIERYRFYLDRIVNFLEFKKPKNTWTTSDILTLIEGEIRDSQSMDAPNKPGYYRANND